MSLRLPANAAGRVCPGAGRRFGAVVGVLAGLALVGFGRRAAAEEYRRPGLEGAWSRRHLTSPMNSLNILAGPGQPMLLGARFGEQGVVDGGGAYLHRGPLATPNPGQEFWLRGGVAFGLTKDWEAGALFLPFRVAPDFTFSSITVFITRGFRFKDWDTGIRVLFQTPYKNAEGERVWQLNPSIPLLYRAGAFRFDAALVVPFASRDWRVGLSVPLRASVNIDPHVFVGLESGFVKPNFNDAHDLDVPLGALAGYTALFGSRVVDFTGLFSWDHFLSPSPAPGTSAFDAATYRIGFGVVFHSLVQ
ncbi:MAG TPA: hypothetical protein VER11_09260 [Polyangiaceae bacterium]|nr:hypothetical protein [Polyangiaceae bacterium]